MLKLGYKTNGNEKPKGKPRVYFACHHEDFQQAFPRLCRDLFQSHDCAVYYTEDMQTPFAPEEAALLREYNLVVVAVTRKLLETPNRAMDMDIPQALQLHVPVLPVLLEPGLDGLYTQPDKFGSLQYLSAVSTDDTQIAYQDKLKKYLDAVLLSRDTAERIRAAFSARIFLSYRKKDRSYANTLMRMIHAQPGCRDMAIWFDEFLVPGKSFSQSISEVLAGSDLFALLVTPNVLEEPDGKPNFVMGEEYPAARSAGLPILPICMEQTDMAALREKFEGLPACVDPSAAEEFSLALAQLAARLGKGENNPVHDFLIGLAYLEGIDMEIDRQRGLELITAAAHGQLPEAMEKLILMYALGSGVARDQAQADAWSKTLAAYFYQQVFGKRQPEALAQLFSHYADPYWRETIRQFLLLASEQMSAAQAAQLWQQLTGLGVQEYTLLFTVAAELPNHRAVAQRRLLTDILEKSAEGVYPPYGPLFWYVPEFSLYEALLSCLPDLTDHRDFAKMLALSRDVCWIFGHYHRAAQVTKKLDFEKLLEKATLWGVRRELCRLFFLGEADASVGAQVYPRCFNVREAKAFMDTGSGIWDLLTEPFQDELGLYQKEMFSILAGEWIGISAMPYVAEEMSGLLAAAGGGKLRGLILTDTEEEAMGYIACNRKHIAVLYLPEKPMDLWFRSRWRAEMPLGQDVVQLDNKLFYFRTEACFPKGLRAVGMNACGGSLAQRIRLPEGLRQVGFEAFENCPNLQSVQLPASAQQLEERAFSTCLALKEITFGEGLQVIKDHAFYQCIALERVALPEGLEKLGAAAFGECSSLREVTFGRGLKEIAAGAFANCTALEEVRLPAGLQTLGQGVFSGCTHMKVLEGCPVGYTHSWLGLPENVRLCYREEALRKLRIPGETGFVAEKAYYGEDTLGAVTIEEGVLSLGENAFGRCVKLQTVALPGSLRQIGENCFQYCSGLTEVSLPKGLETIGGSAFWYCLGLREVVIPQTVEAIEEKCFLGCAALERVVLPEGLKRIGRKAFWGCQKLQEVTLPDSLQALEELAFEGCRLLKAVHNCPAGCDGAYLGLPETVEIAYRREAAKPCQIEAVGGELLQRQYAHRRDISRAVFPEGVTKLGEQSFLCCAGLEELQLRSGVTEIGREAFRQCVSLRRVWLPDSVTELKEAAFAGCRALEAVRLPKALSGLEDKVFAHCVSLRRVCLPEGMTWLGDAFVGCRALEEVQLPEGLHSIGSSFTGCENLRQVVIPAGVEDLGGNAFAGCHRLEAVQLPKGMTYIGLRAFADCTALKRLVLPEGLEQIGRYLCQGCRLLEEVVIPETVTYISRRAFEGCSRLETICIPETVEVIEPNAFAGCEGVKVLTLPERFRDSLGEIFGGAALSDVELHWL